MTATSTSAGPGPGAHAQSYYAATATPAPLQPRLEGTTDADVCVVGGGFTGLSAALHLAERGYRVVLLEARRIGWGASGRNGGQIGSGQRQDVLWMEARLGRDTAQRLWALAEEAKTLLRERIERHRIACDHRPGNLLAITRQRHVAEYAAEAEHLARHYGYDQLRMLDRPAMREAVASEAYVAGRLDTGGGHLHPLNLALGLADAARAAGAELHEGSAVVGIDWEPTPVVRTAHGAVRAANVALCANGYLDGLEPRVAANIMPIVNHVIATAPLGAERARALIRDDVCVAATKFVVDYYRLTPDHRLLFGGGETYSPREMPDVRGFVRRYMLAVFPQLADARIDYGWSGTLAITINRMPHFARVGRHGFCAHGFSGHGVALTQLAGKLLAEAIAGTAERFDLMASLPHRAFPGGRWLRHPLLVAGMLWYALRDRL